jgi:hypothetical protein
MRVGYGGVRADSRVAPRIFVFLVSMRGRRERRNIFDYICS